MAAVEFAEGPLLLLRLWRGGADAADAAAVAAVQWRLLCWCVDPEAACGAGAGAGGSAACRLRALPPRLALPAAALRALHRSGVLAAALADTTLTLTPEHVVRCLARTCVRVSRAA